MKKTLALILSLILCTSCLFGCGGGVDETKKKSAADSDDTVVTVWSGEGGAQAVWEELVDNYNSTTGDEKNIFIDWVTMMDATAADVAQQSGQLPEIVNISGTRLNKYQASGDLAAIDELPGGKEFLEEYDFPGVEGSNVFDGKTYTLHRNAKVAGLAYNKDLFKKAGIVDKNGEAKAPETISEMREAAKKITALGGGVYGYAFPLKFGTSWTVTTPTANSFDLDTPASEINLDTLTVTYNGHKDRFQWLLDMKEDGSLFPGAETLDNDTARAYFSSGIIGMIPSISWDVGVYSTQFPAECDWDVCRFPILDGYEFTENSVQIGGGLAISKNALKNDKIAKATMEAYKFIYSLETRTELFERGIEVSCKTDVLDVVDRSKLDPRLIKFAELVPEKVYRYPSENYTVEGENWDALFQKVWMGDITLDAAIKDLETRATAGLRKAVKNGNYNVARQKETEAQKRADFEAKKAAK